MKRIITAALAILIAAIFVISLFGCSTLTVNEEKDAQSVVATINGEDIIKSDFLDYLDFNLILYTINGYDLPTEDDETYDTLVEDIFNDFIANLTYEQEALMLGLEADTQTVTDSVEELTAMALEYFGNDEALYTEFLADYGLTQETFRELAQKELSMLSWSNIYTENEDNDYSVVTEQTAVTVGDVDLQNYLLYYFYITDTLYAYINDGTYPSGSDEILALFDTEITYLANAQALIAYAEENGIEVTQEEIDEQLASVDYILTYFGEETMDSLYSSYYLTEEQVDAARQFMGTAYAISAKIEDDTIATYEATDKELKDYYKENEANYDESTANVYHIVTEYKDFAQQLEDEAGGTGEGFMAVYEKYKDNELVKEAAQYDITKTTNFVQEFMDAVFDNDEGDVIGMVETNHGYHLIYINEKNDVPLPDFEDIRDTLKEDFMTDNQDTIVADALQEIYDGPKVKEGDYRMLPEEVLIKALEDKYNVTIKLKVALR